MTAVTSPARGGERPGIALVLSGGGARGAYQVGVLQGLVEAGFVAGGRSEFDVLVGSSAGAINAGMLAAHADRLTEGIEALARVWGSIEPQQVFRTDLRSLGSIGAKWVRDLSFGGVLRRVAPKSLLDTAPLRALLTEAIPFERIQGNVEAGALRALAIPATDLYTSDGVVFVQGRPDLPLWKRGRWEIERTQIGVEHLMASSAIPIFFSSVEIDGRHFGDGSIRNTAPLSPAINLGADRIVAIGVRGPGADRATVRRRAAPTVAQIAGALLDAVMIDAIEVDVEHSDRVNTSVISLPGAPRDDPFRWIDVLWLSPSSEFGAIAAALSNRIPRIVRYLMRGLGPDESTVELASYLLFDASFCSQLIELGKADVAAREEEIRAFFRRPSPGRQPGG